MQNQLQSFAASPAIWDHTTTSHPRQVNAIIPAKQVGTQLTYPGGMEG